MQNYRRFFIENDKIVLDFNNYSELIKGEEKIEEFIKELRKEVAKFKKYMEYRKNYTINFPNNQNASL